MALTERSRAALYRGLSDMLDDEEAVGQVLSYFPTRDADEPASRDFVDARVASVEARVDILEARVDAGFASVNARMDAGFASVESRFASVESRFASVDARMDAGFASVESRFASVDARMDTGFASVDARMEVEFAKQREAIESKLHTEIRTMTRWAVGTIIAVAGLLLALGVVG